MQEVERLRAAEEKMRKQHFTQAAIQQVRDQMVLACLMIST